MITAHQLSRRYERVWASQVPAIVGANPYQTSTDLWYDFLGLADPQPTNDAMEIGSALEPAIVKVAEAKLGKLRRGAERVCKHVTVNGVRILGAHLDAAVVASPEEIVEIKTSGLLGGKTDGWGDEGTSEIPDAVAIQTTVQMMCAEAVVCHVVALIAGRGIKFFRVERDEDLCDAIASKVESFWLDHILPYRINGTKNAPSETPSLDVLKRLKRIERKTIDVDPALVDMWTAAKACASAAKKQVDHCKAGIIASLDDAEIGILPDGTELTYTEQTTATYTVAAKTYRVLRGPRKARKESK